MQGWEKELQPENEAMGMTIDKEFKHAYLVREVDGDMITVKWDTTNPPYGDDHCQREVYPWNHFVSDTNWHVKIQYLSAEPTWVSFRIEALPELIMALYELWEKWMDGKLIE